MFTSMQHTTLHKTMKLRMLSAVTVILLILCGSLYAQNEKSNTTSNSNSKNEMIVAKSNSSDQEKEKDKKKEKEDKALQQAGKKAKTVKVQNSSNEKQTNQKAKQNEARPVQKSNSSTNKARVIQNKPSVARPDNDNNKSSAGQSQGTIKVVPQRIDKVEQQNNGGLIPDATVQHNDGNHSPNDGHDWTDHHGDNNHAHIGFGGYYHDSHQHDFYTRRHHWHNRYSFFEFRLGFDTYHNFPYDYLYYYPTDYVIVDSRLSVIVLPFIYEDDEGRFDDNISDNLNTELEKLRRFHVIESGTVRRIMSRNDIIKSDLVETSSAKELGRLADTDLVIMGTIDRSSDHVTLTVKGVDPFTGETVISETATSDLTDSNSVDRLVKYMAVLIYNDVPLSEGAITDIMGDEVSISIGNNHGILPGTRCVVYREGREVRHPYTGEYLGQKITKIGEIYVTDIQDNNSTANIITRSARFRVGDKIIVK